MRYLNAVSRYDLELVQVRVPMELWTELSELCPFCLQEDHFNTENEKCHEHRLKHGCSCGDCWVCN